MIFYFNPNVGSAIEYSGNIYLSWMNEVYDNIYNYKFQNPSPIIYSELEKINPDIIVINEYYKRNIEAVYFYKQYKKDVRIIFINYVWSHLLKDIGDRNETLFFQDFFVNECDVIFCLNRKPDHISWPTKYPKIIDQVCPTDPSIFNISNVWRNRKNDFLYLGNILPHKFDIEFIRELSGTDIIIDCYGRIFDNDRYTNEFVKCDNINYLGFLPQNNVPEILNQYRYLVMPHANIPEPFNLTLLQSIYCGTIPLIKNDTTDVNYNYHWLDWADTFYFGCNKNCELLKNMINLRKDNFDFTSISEDISIRIMKKFNYLNMKSEFQRELLNLAT